MKWWAWSWNPIRGCSPASPGCRRCYALRMAARSAGPGRPFHGFVERDTETGVWRWTGRVEVMEHRLDMLPRFPAGAVVFANSTTDFCHPSLSDADVLRIIAKAVDAADKSIIFSTKRPARLARLLSANYLFGAVKHLWWGITIEDATRAQQRIPDLRKISDLGFQTYVNAEPLLERWDPDLLFDSDGYPIAQGIIVGGETGKGGQAVDLDLVRELRDFCDGDGVEFYYKQRGGGCDASAYSRLLDGREHNDLPWRSA